MLSLTNLSSPTLQVTPGHLFFTDTESPVKEDEEDFVRVQVPKQRVPLLCIAFGLKALGDFLGLLGLGCVGFEPSGPLGFVFRAWAGGFRINV